MSCEIQISDDSGNLHGAVRGSRVVNTYWWFNYTARSKRHPSATSGAPTSQCGLIDALVIVNVATPGATQAATAPAIKPTTNAPTVVAPTSAPAEGGASEAGGGDEALTTYRDAAQKFSIDYPRSWSQEPTFKSGVCFAGRDASIAVQFVTIAPADLMAYVKADEAKVQAGSPGYKAVYLKPSSVIQGAVILGYEWDAGKSTVTEKPVRARTDRYYLIDRLGRFVIISETAPINQFDPAGTSDTVLTYQATK